jgi:hypothetical protein
MLSNPSFGRVNHRRSPRVPSRRLFLPCQFHCKVIDAGNQHLVTAPPAWYGGMLPPIKGSPRSSKPALINKPPPSEPRVDSIARLRQPDIGGTVASTPPALQSLARLYRPDRGCGGNYILVTTPTIANHSLPMKEWKNDP